MKEFGYGQSGAVSGGGYLRNVEILIAEDNDFARTMLRDVLKILGANRVQYANDGKEALSIAHNFPIEIALIDWYMPLVDGIEFTKTIRTATHSPNSFLPIIMISSYAEMKQVMEARDAGVNEYLIKPYSAKQLLTRIKSVVERPRSFIKIDSYFGPDRRRKKDKNYQGKERRKPVEAEVQQTEADA